ncbi:hypothetical protein VNI00_004347 [Paramarasmius palmivorus]|uniref:Uncharacterized protein n=1 Tax=Paramarasmius palmivorus TaxID=297713 RepID=A0AAW0DQ75_9AGAR
MPRKPPSISPPFEELWRDIVFPLDQFFKGPTTDSSALDTQSYMKATYACFNLCTSQPHSSDASSLKLQNPELARPFRTTERTGIADDGPELHEPREHKCLFFYEKLDSYFAEHARSLRPQNTDTLDIRHLVGNYQTYAAAVKKADRVLNYFNRHLVERWRDEGKGGFKINRDSQGKLTEKTENRAVPWGYEEGGGNIEDIQGYAEAGSKLMTVVSVNATGLRRFRTEVVEVLDLEVALGREMAESEKEEVVNMLKQIGFPPNHRWRKMLQITENQVT